ncbi:MAG TPA: hypothetical protein VMP01_20170 [Pirellulaceae bacterium]|nr:hypothetical protein [Pirellulaceae bacterium]
MRSLFIAIFVVAVSTAWLRSQIVGRIQLEGNDGAIIVGTGSSPIIALNCTSPQHARDLASSFDRDRFISLARNRIHERVPMAEPSLENVAVYLGNDGNLFFIKYDVRRWGRYRFDLSQFCYRLDLDDPIAQSYNAAIDDAFADAGRRVADESTQAINLGPLP